MFALALVLAGAFSPAGAQMPPGGLAGLGASFGAPAANSRFVVADVVSKRFPGEDVVGPTFTTGEQVEVIVEENGSVRVRQGERYGWVPAAQLVMSAPMSSMPMSVPGANPLLGGLKPLLPSPTPAPAAAP